MNNAKFYTAKEVAQLLGFSTNTVYKYLDEGKIKATRLGTEGRFRIPADEMQHMLQQKHPTTLVESQIAQVSQTTTQEISILERLYSPNILSYFAVVLAIVTGIALFLPSSYLLDVRYQPVRNFLFPMGWIFILVGVFGILPDILFSYKRPLQYITHIALSGSFFILGVGFFFFGNTVNGLTYSLIAIVLFVGFLIPHVSHKLAFLLLVTGLTFIFGLYYPAHSEFLPLAVFAEFAAGNALLFTILWFAITIPGLILFFIALSRKRLFMILTFISGVISLLFATILVANDIWDRALFSVVMGTFFFLLPVEEKFHTFTKVRRRSIFGSFMWLTTILAVGLLLIMFTQAKMKQYVISQNLAYLALGRTTVEEFVNQGVSSTDAASKRKSLIAALSTKDSALLNDVAKNIYESTNVFRRVVIADSQGTVLVTYPRNEGFIGTSVKIAEKSSLTDVFSNDQESLFASSPVFSEKGELLGVVNDSIDLAILRARLDKINKSALGNRFVVVNKEGRYVINKKDFIGKKASLNEAVVRAAQGEAGSLETYNEAGKLILSVFAPIPSLAWGISLQVPSESAFRLGNTVSLVVFLITTSVSIGTLLVLFYFERPLFSKSL